MICWNKALVFLHCGDISILIYQLEYQNGF